MRFFDTHAILGVLSGEAAYQRFASAPGVTHQMNLLEALVHLLRRHVPHPRRVLQRMGLGIVAATDEDLDVAAAIKTDPLSRERNLSYVDALGYAIARRHGIPFLTGDRGFKDLAGVDFAQDA